MRSSILQVYIGLGSVDSHQCLFQLHIAKRTKKKKKEEEGKTTWLHRPNKHSGLCFLFAGREVNMKSGPGQKKRLLLSLS